MKCRSYKYADKEINGYKWICFNLEFERKYFHRFFKLSRVV